MSTENGFTERRLREILKEELDEHQKSLVQMLSMVGLDMNAPLEQQDDFRHLRRWRKIVEGGGIKAAIYMMAITFAGAISAAWYVVVGIFHPALSH